MLKMQKGVKTARQKLMKPSDGLHIISHKKRIKTPWKMTSCKPGAENVM